MPDLSRITGELEQEKKGVRAKLDEVRSKAAALEEDLERISSALKALRGEKSKKRKSTKPPLDSRRRRSSDQSDPKRETQCG